MTEEEEIQHYKEALKRLRFDYCRMVSDDFDRYEEGHNINIYEKFHENGDISKINEALNLYEYFGEKSGLDKTFRYSNEIYQIIRNNFKYIANSIEDEELRKLVLINKLYYNEKYSRQTLSQFENYCKIFGEQNAFKETIKTYLISINEFNTYRFDLIGVIKLNKKLKVFNYSNLDGELVNLFNEAL